MQEAEVKSTKIGQFFLLFKPSISKTLLKNWIKNGYIELFFVGVLQLIGNFLVLKLAGQYFDNTQFGLFVLSRRAIGLISFIVLIGMGISFPRYLARTTTQEEKCLYTLGVSIIIFIMLFILYIVFHLFQNEVTRLCFGNVKFKFMMLPLFVSVCGMCLYTVVYSFFRGLLRIWLANIMQMVAMIISPVLAIILNPRFASLAIYTMGFMWIVCSCSALALMLKPVVKSSISLRKLVIAQKKLLKYGLPRVPGEFGLFGLFSIPSFMVARYYGIEEAGLFSFGLSIIQMIGSLFTIPGIVLLPYISRLDRKRQWLDIHEKTRTILLSSLLVVTIITFLSQIFLPRFILFFMGERFMSSVNMYRILVLGVIPYVVYLVLRNPLDAISAFPFNSINLLLSLSLVVFLIALVRKYISPDISICAGLSLLGFTSFLVWKHQMNNRLSIVVSKNG